MKSVLFVGQAVEDASRATEVFNASARKLGLAWSAESRGLAAMLETDGEEQRVSAASIIVIGAPDRASAVQARFPEIAGRVACWPLSTPAMSDGRLELEVHNLVAGILGGRASHVPAASEDSPSPPRAKSVTVRVGRETKGRKGKGVTTISDLPLSEADLRELATLLKGRCGTGGTVRDGRIEIQGDQRDRITAELQKLGYRVKRAGG